MDVRETSDLLGARQRTGKAYFEFFRAPSMSCGLYELPKGSRDLQSLHTEDEVYYVIRGRARIRVGSEEHAVRPGTIIFVPALAAHRFHDIQQDLAALVYFAPPEGSGASSRESDVK